MSTPRKACKKCVHAVVGRHQICRCEVRGWYGVPLDRMHNKKKACFHFKSTEEA